LGLVRNSFERSGKEKQKEKGKETAAAGMKGTAGREGVRGKVLLDLGSGSEVREKDPLLSNERGLIKSEEEVSGSMRRRTKG